MSTLAYGNLTARREKTTPVKTARKAGPRGLYDEAESDTPPPSGISGYIDAVAALVPAEVLALHAIILTFTTETVQGTDDLPVTQMTKDGAVALGWVFYGLIIMSIVLYFIGKKTKPDSWDWIRALIPPLAFVCWTMLQKTTAFDAICKDMNGVTRTVIALFVAVFLGIVAAYLAKKADQNPEQPIPPVQPDPPTG